ncbi:c-type cytochrome [Lysobacter korlensis]|uniref:C-type cytochrome n=1 Tax=Lysobacter korlensis TaxID=553636 RepID=A0ABV6RPC9_9GAMM
MTNRSILAIALLTLLATGCNNQEAEAEGHTETHNRVAGMSESSAGLPKGSIEAGEKLANLKREGTGQSCVDCHGAEGNAPIDGSYPKLGGQHSDYLAHALQSYRIGRRDNALMKGQAETLTDRQIADLSAYFGSRESDLGMLVNTDGNFTNVDSE